MIKDIWVTIWYLNMEYIPNGDLIQFINTACSPFKEVEADGKYPQQPSES